MNSLAVNLSKEWREQRGALGVLAVVALGAVGVATATLSRATLQDPLVAQWIVGLTVLATVMSIGADLLARERQRGLEFLARIPHGLERAARGKLCFFALVLFGAFAYGALLAAAASLARTGALPIGALDRASLWLPIALAVSLWVFAVSAWMPNSALTLPATAFFLGVFAFPAVLAIVDDAVFRPTPIEGLAFIALCIAGAPVSAWASFVVGSRRGRSRGRAALIGMLAAVPFFAPAWIWAGQRYWKFDHAPFQIRFGLAAAGEHYAFLTLARETRPDGRTVDNDFERRTAAIVNLADGSWRFAGDIDASEFSWERSYGRRYSLLGVGGCTRFSVFDREFRETTVFDGDTALPVGDGELTLAPRPAPADFGLLVEPARYQISCAGLGHKLTVVDGTATPRALYRDLARNLVLERAALLQGADHGERLDVRIRSGRWLVGERPVQRREGETTVLGYATWRWFDPVSRAWEPASCFQQGEDIGMLSIEDGRFVVSNERGAFILDPETGARTPIHAVNDPSTVWRIGEYFPPSTPLQCDQPSVVFASSRDWRGVAALDVRDGTLRTAASSGKGLPQLLSAHGPEALAIEEMQRIVRYDLERGTREVLFEVADVN